MLPTLHHGVGVNQSRLDYQTITSDNRNSNIANINSMEQSESRLNKSRLLDYPSNLAGGVVGGVGGSNGYSSEHMLLSNQQQQQQIQQSKAQNKYGSDYSHLPHIRQND